MARERKSTRWQLRIGERRILLLLGDFAISLISLVIAIYIWGSREAESLEFFNFISERLQFWFFLLPLIWMGLLVESYDPSRSSNFQKTASAISSAALIATVLYLSVYFTASSTLPRLGVAVFIISSASLTLGWRMIYIRVFTAPQFMHRVLLVGAGSTGQALLEVIQDLWPQPYFVAGLIDDDPKLLGKEILGYKVIGGNECLLETIEAEHITDLIVAISGRMVPATFQALLDAQEKGLQITRMPVAYEDLLDRVPVKHLEADWILRSFIDQARVNTFYIFAKRALDILGGIVGIIILLFIGPLITIAIYLESGRPIVFEQDRVGKGGTPFNILKFRSMRHDAEADGIPHLAEENDERSTKVGRILRKTHLDEWLQFVNVLKGEMSLVGPRPERPELNTNFQEKIPFYRGRNMVKPGIAGWAQIHLDYAANLDEIETRLEYDLYYIKHRNIVLDIIILLRTVATVIGFRGR